MTFFKKWFRQRDYIRFLESDRDELLSDISAAKREASRRHIPVSNRSIRDVVMELMEDAESGWNHAQKHEQAARELTEGLAQSRAKLLAAEEQLSLVNHLRHRIEAQGVA